MKRLTQSTDTSLGGYGTRAYSYDLNGNRTSLVRNGATSVYTYNPANWVTSDGQGGDQRQRDADGNTIYTPEQGRFVYDGYEHLVAVRTRGDEQGDHDDGDGPGARYAYNAFGERIWKQAQGEDTRFVYGPGSRLLAELDRHGQIEDYVWLGNMPLARLDSRIDHDQGGDEDHRGDHDDHDRDRGLDDRGQALVYYFHTDALGTPQAMTDAKGQVVWQARYLPFGKVQLQVAKITNNLRFPGQYFDAENGLNYNLHRTYDPSVGRYIEADPMGWAAGSNPYAYVGNNPLNRIDPYGLWSLSFQAYDVFGGGFSISGEGFSFTSVGIRLGVGVGAGFSFNPKGGAPDPSAKSKCGSSNSIGLFGEASLGAGPLSAGIGGNVGGTEQVGNNAWNGYGGSEPSLTAGNGTDGWPVKLSGTGIEGEAEASAGLEITHNFSH